MKLFMKGLNSVKPRLRLFLHLLIDSFNSFLGLMYSFVVATMGNFLMSILIASSEAFVEYEDGGLLV